MKVTEPEVAGQYAALYQATVDQAVGGAKDLMARLVAHVRATLRKLEDSAVERRERDRLTDSRRMLNQFEASLCERFTEELLTAFARLASVERASPAQSPELQFDKLAQMDESRLRQSVQTARVQHTVQLAADTALADLNGLICTMLGLATVRLDRNPLRPAVYVDAMTAAVTQLPVLPVVRTAWLTMMSGALGRELDVYYRSLCADLRQRGVGYGAEAVGRPQVAAGPGAAAEVAMPRDASPLLTLEALRRLLAEPSGDAPGDASARPAPDAPQLETEREFEDGQPVPTGFRATVPAAFEALQEMKQLDTVVRRVEERLGTVAQPLDGSQEVRERLRRSARGLKQSLGLEVVALMVDNIRHDQRLLGPVQHIVSELEPALLQLALVDPRFFSHRQHPARRLLHEITHRSIAYESVDSRGFSGFMEPLREAVAPLAQAVIQTAEPFDQALGRVVGLWDEPGAKEKREMAKAVEALREAEQRNVLAATIVGEIQARPDAALVPDAVFDFLCGPWAQVVAHARMSDESGSDDPGDYAALIESLMWSAQPHLTRKKVGALTRLIPALLARLRQGLATIHYPPQKTSGFFEILMNLHQRGFKPGAAAAGSSAGKARDLVSDAARLGASESTWIAPLEAKASGFIELPDDLPRQAQDQPASGQIDELRLGVWVALLAEGGWTRTRLTWVSPNSTLFLFTDALNYLQSLTRRACDQLFASGQLRVLSADPVEDALDAVAQAALRNSVDIRF